MAGLAVFLGAALGFAAVKFKVQEDPIVEKIDAILPQTQCGQCGFPGCKPYAQAIADGTADINQCPPGGEDGIHKLADLLGVEFKPLNAEPDYYTHLTLPPNPHVEISMDSAPCKQHKTEPYDSLLTS